MIAELSLALLAAIAVLALLTGVLHGATGMAGGIVMASILAHMVGIKVAVPVMTIALVFSHASRAMMFSGETDWRITGRVLLFGVPTIILGAIIFSKISSTTIEVVFAAFLATSIPIKHWARHHEIQTGPRTLAAASSVWGMLAGNVIGPGFFLAPFLLGTGMNRMTFVGTLATVTLVMNVVKLIVFETTGLVTTDIFMVGVAIGVITIPGNWLGRLMLQKMHDKDHRLAIDVMTLLMIANFVYLAMT